MEQAKVDRFMSKYAAFQCPLVQWIAGMIQSEWLKLLPQSDSCDGMALNTYSDE